MLKIFLCEPIHPRALALLKTRAEVFSDPACLGRADAAISRNLRMDAAFLEQCPALKVIGIHGTGTDRVDLAAAAQRGVRVVYAPGENAQSVAELIVGLTLALARRVYLADRMLQTGEALAIADARLTGMELHGKTLGLVGVGSIARRAAEMFRRAFGMSIVGYSPSLTEERAACLGIAHCTCVREVFARADVVSIGVPLTPQTRGLVGTAELAAAKPGALLVNTARGGVVDEDALYRALTQGPLGAAACDVLAHEPPAPGLPLLRLPNFLATPHLGAATDEALLRVGMCVVEQIFTVLDGKTPAHECVGTTDRTDVESEHK